MRQRSDRQRRLVLLLFIFLVAFLPRLSALGRYVTPDELNWVFRSAGLRQALLAQDWGATLRSPHPGVTTTWLGALAIQIQLGEKLVGSRAALLGALIGSAGPICGGAGRAPARLFDSQGAQLGVFHGQGQFAGTSAQVAEVTVSPPPSQPPLASPHSYGDGPGLVGFAPLPDRASNGATLTVDLWWQTEEPARYQLALSFGTAATAEPWPLDARSWKTGQRYHSQPRWRLPVDLPAGRQPLRLQLLDAAGNAVWPAPVPLGEIEVDVRERAFSLPAGLDPLAIEAGTLAYLQGVAVTPTDQALEVNVIWQARAETDTEYTAFVHLLDEAGNVVAQVDRPPAPPATSWVPEQVIAESYSLPRPDGTGTYRIALGLYDPDSGRRLPLYADGEQLADDAYPVGIPAP